jgi:hypothetical protein
MMGIRIESFLAASYRVNNILDDEITNGGDDTEGQWASARNGSLWDEE